MSETNGWTGELGVLTIAEPCRARWESMIGSEQKRYCARCHLNVYNLSAMDTEEARALLQKSEGRLCVRFYGRDDGKVLTRDCPVGVAARLRRKALGVLGAIVAVLFAMLRLARLHTPQDAVELPVAEPLAVKPVTQAPPPLPTDEKWMDQRRALIGGRESWSTGRRRETVSMGVIRGPLK